jgi:hypothetical protein
LARTIGRDLNFIEDLVGRIPPSNPEHQQLRSTVDNIYEQFANQYYTAGQESVSRLDNVTESQGETLIAQNLDFLEQVISNTPVSTGFLRGILRNRADMVYKNFGEAFNSYGLASAEMISRTNPRDFDSSLGTRVANRLNSLEIIMQRTNTNVNLRSFLLQSRVLISRRFSQSYETY